MRPDHHPEIKSAMPPASAEIFDESAISGINGQRRRLEAKVRGMGGETEARLPGHDNVPLYGYRFRLDDDTEIELPIDVSRDEEGILTGPDAEFVRARHRLAVLESREQSRGSRSGNWAYDEDRHPAGENRRRVGRAISRVLRLFRSDPAPTTPQADYGYGRRTAKTRYRDELAKFIARKIDAHPELDDEASVTQASARANLQELYQMNELQRIAAEQKNSTRILNGFRNHKVLRLATGMALGVGAALTGGLTAGALAALRVGLGGAGGYVSLRTLWDGFQGKRAQKVAIDDIRATRTHESVDHFYATDSVDYRNPRDNDEAVAASQAFIRILAAEARAGSQKTERQRAARVLGENAVRGTYERILNFSGGIDAAAIESQVRSLHANVIAPVQERRLASDQTQSRKRHIAGLAGALAFGGLAIAAPFIDIIPQIKAKNPFGFINFGGDETNHADKPGNGGGSADGGNGNNNGYGRGNNGSGNGGLFGENPANQDGYSRAYGDQLNIHIIGDENHVTVGTDHEGSGHGDHDGHGSEDGDHHHHETIDGITTKELHVKSGGGFISTLQEQYGLSPEQADAIYRDMYEELKSHPGTYMEGSDIRISSPGDFRLSEDARAVLEERLRALDKMPEVEHHSGAVSHEGGTRRDIIDGRTGEPRPLLDYLDTENQPHVNSVDSNVPDLVNIIELGDNNHTHVILPDPNSPEGEQIGAIINGAYVPETGINGLHPNQAAQAQALLMDYLNNPQSQELSAKAKELIKEYAEYTAENGGSSSGITHDAAERIRHMLATIDINNMTLTQAKQLEKDLALANAG